MYEVCITCPKLGNPCNGPNFSALSTTERLEWIKKRKKHLGWTHSKLAEESNTPKGTIDSLLSGTRTGANTETLRPIFEALIGGYTDGKPCPNPPTAESDNIAQHTETISSQDKRIKELEDENRRLKDHIRSSNEHHARDKENAVKEYRRAYKLHLTLSCVLAVLTVVAYFL